VTRAGRVAAAALAALALGASPAPGPTPEPAAQPLELEAKIPLGEVPGRLDHLAVDAKRNRLYVAELEYDSVGIVDLKAGKVARTIHGFAAPQGIDYCPGADTVAVANGKNGTVDFLRGPKPARAGELALGADADNVHVAPDGSHFWVGYGSGGLAEIDCTSRKLTKQIPLPAHPEGFAFVPALQRILVNLPDAKALAGVNVKKSRVFRQPNKDSQENYPLALDPSTHRALSAFRKPPELGVFDSGSGERVEKLDTCGDADDLFVDDQRHRAYVICGEGAVDVFAQRNGSWKHLARVATAPGARTGRYVPELDRLYVAVRASEGVPAAIWVLRPR